MHDLDSSGIGDSIDQPVALQEFKLSVVLCTTAWAG